MFRASPAEAARPRRQKRLGCVCDTLCQRRVTNIPLIQAALGARRTLAKAAISQKSEFGDAGGRF
jgi:hypothetical protein